MPVKEIAAKSILRKHKFIDAWFLCRYGMNIYRGCTHNCAYCDGRAERYHVEGEFGEDVTVKINAVELLEKALDPRRKRKPLIPSFMAIGGGVGDSYQPIEDRYGLTRKVLEVFERYGLPVHVLTKCSLVERDFDILKRIHDKARVIINLSLSSADDGLGAIYEPGASLPSERLATLARAKQAGFVVAAMLLPVIPGVTDSSELIDESVAKAKEAGVDYLLFGGMTLKGGRQQRHFLSVLARHRPAAVEAVEALYPGNKWGQARGDYYRALDERFSAAAKRHGVPRRIPTPVFGDILNENDRVNVVLQNLDYLMRLERRRSPFRTSGYSVAKLPEPISAIRDNLQQLRGVGPGTERLIIELLDTGRCRYHDDLL